VRVTGERVVTKSGGFNPTWQRHAANYLFAAGFLGDAPEVLDLGCGMGQAVQHLGERRSIGVDLDAGALKGQGRPTVRADLGRLPFSSCSVDALVFIHAVEHLADPDASVAECARALRPGGCAVLATPNRLTFGRPDEIIDPYHTIEFDPAEFHRLCSPHFARVEVHGIFGSPRYMEFYKAERVKLDALLRLDPLRLRRFIPVALKRRLYDRRLTKERLNPDPGADTIELSDFFLSAQSTDQALDLIAVCTK
jgi:SAM-dependent methyltransferase